ncbi:hypothetical protein SAMN05421690_10774 [Nitrosomonas sp. Nm51]|nr:hypothetical protein SAMN05421690_10774 [Nitrosomonas sp. Nm51]
MLFIDEAAAPVIREAMKGFASGRFHTKTEVQYFLESCPEFPKHTSGKLGFPSAPPETPTSSLRQALPLPNQVPKNA